MELFSNREIALIFWCVIISLYILFSSKVVEVRKSFRGVISAFFVRQIQLIIILMIIYISAAVYLLSEFDIWDISQFKNTVIWMVSVASMSFFQIEAIKKDRKFFKHSVLDNLKLIAVIQFIISVYAFPVLAEIILLPILTIIVLMAEVAGKERGQQQVKNILNNIIVGFGLIVMMYAVYMLFADVGKIAKEQTIYDFIIPVLLTFLFLPFIFFLMVYVSYENVLIRLQYSIKEPRHIVFSKVLVMLVFNVRIELLERWASTLTSEDTSSYRGIWNSVIKIFKMRRAERILKNVDPTLGWCPYKSKDILMDQGIKTGYYHESYGEWYAASPLVDIGGGIFPNNIAFYIDGEESVAKSLKLKLNVNNIKAADLAHEEFTNFAETLYKFLTGSNLPSWLSEALLSGRTVNETMNDFINISVEKEAFHNRAFDGYDIKFVISNQN